MSSVNFLLQDESVVVSCEKVKDVKKAVKELGLENVKEQTSLYKVILDDTILFPEGGGQVSLQLLRILRKSGFVKNNQCFMSVTSQMTVVRLMVWR